MITKCICPYCKMYLSTLQSAFVHIAKCICKNCVRVAQTSQCSPLTRAESCDEDEDNQDYYNYHDEDDNHEVGHDNADHDNHEEIR